MSLAASDNANELAHKEGTLKQKSMIKWLPKPKEDDYSAAETYLSLVVDASLASRYVKKLSKEAAVSFKARDIFRASLLPLLGAGNFHVEKDRQKITAGKALSPLLLVRDDVNRKVIIADGYHRLCAVYTYDEDALIPCRIV
jgi:hypothetical protein